MTSRRRVLAQLVLITLATTGLGALAAGRFAIGVDGQTVRCLPWKVFLIDRSRTAPRRLDFVAFRARGLAPLVADGTLLVKQVIGMPGDVVQVRDGRFRINGVDRGRLDPLVGARSGLHPLADEREHTLADGEYALLGQHPASFDSRYFGAVSLAQVVGEATPLW